MSKMTKPTVGVVRFQESDVIVASLRVSGFTKADGLDTRGTMTFNGVITATYDGPGTPIAFLDAIRSAGYGTSMNSITYSEDYTGDPKYDIVDLFESDWGSYEYAFAANGTYHWDAAENTWKQ